jgi:hypothetical protein
MSFIAAYRKEIEDILNTYVFITSNEASVRKTDDFYFGGEEERFEPPAQKISYVPHLRIFLKGTASLVSSIGLTIISLIAKLVNKDEYEEWFREERKELKQTFGFLGHFGMMCIRPEIARPKLQEFLRENRY